MYKGLIVKGPPSQGYQHFSYEPESQVWHPSWKMRSCFWWTNGDFLGPASSKWPFDSPIGDHLSPEKVTYWFKRGHFEEPGDLLLLVMFFMDDSTMIKHRETTIFWDNVFGAFFQASNKQIQFFWVGFGVQSLLETAIYHGDFYWPRVQRSIIWTYIFVCKAFGWQKWWLGGGFKQFNFYPYLGKIPILTNILEMGWNHQLDKY